MSAASEFPPDLTVVRPHDHAIVTFDLFDINLVIVTIRDMYLYTRYEPENGSPNGRRTFTSSECESMSNGDASLAAFRIECVNVMDSSDGTGHTA